MAAPKDATTQSATKSDNKSEAFKSAYEQLLKLSKDTPSNEQQTLLAQFIANHADTFDFKPYAAFVTKDSNTKLFQTFAHSLSANKENYGMVFQFLFSDQTQYSSLTNHTSTIHIVQIYKRLFSKPFVY